MPIALSSLHNGLRRLCIVTPVFNGAAFIEQTINSVVSQPGDFVLHYHLQDGGSTDGTLAIIDEWLRRHERGDIKLACRQLVLTRASAPDAGLYDAVNRGFELALPPGPDVLMGWIAADDLIAPGAFATLEGISQAFPDFRLFGGRTCLIDESGAITDVYDPAGFSQRCMAAGLYDGRAMRFVMQEATFWYSDVWQAVGGLDAHFRLAGDWDLWRRMAHVTPYISVDSILGLHRRHPAQLSARLGGYYEEVDAALDAGALDAPVLNDLTGMTLRAAHHHVAAEYEQAWADPVAFREGPYAAQGVWFARDHREWQLVPAVEARVPYAREQSPLGESARLAVTATDNLGPLEGPYAQMDLPQKVRWMTAARVEGDVIVDRSGLHEVAFRCRSWHPQRITLLANGQPLASFDVGADATRDWELKVTAVLDVGTQRVGVVTDLIDVAQPLLLVDWSVKGPPLASGSAVVPVPHLPVALASRISPQLSGSHWPKISIVVPTFNQAQFIGDTLASIVRQGYPNLELIVVDGASTDETRLVLDGYSEHIAYRISEPDAGQSDAINKGFARANGEIFSWLNSDDLLADGALHAVAQAFVTSSADVIAGICEVFDDSNRVVHRHLPCLSEGLLPLSDMLDLNNGWLRGEFFHQPEVYFRRTIWEAAGGRVDTSLYFSMDYELWTRIARAGGTIKVIGHPIARYRMHAAQKTSSVEAYLPELSALASKLRKNNRLSALPEKRALQERLRVVVFNDFGYHYGAGIAHGRLARALTSVGHEVIGLAYADFHFGEPTTLTDAQIVDEIAAAQPDVVLVGNLHSIATDCAVLSELVSRDIKTIFYAHDQWLMTGRCAYVGDCRRFRTHCDSSCPTAERYPALPPEEVGASFDARRRMLTDSRARGNLIIATNSRYMRDLFETELPEEARPSVVHLPIGIDTTVFTPGDRWHARRLLGLPPHAFIVLTAATDINDERKGLKVLLDAVAMLPGEPCEIVILGAGKKLDPDAHRNVRYTGFIDREEILALHYQACDVFVGPSRQEAFGQTFIEAAACGIPSIAFAVGGVGDAIVDGLTGILVNELSPAGISFAIAAARQDRAWLRQLGAHARLHAQSYYSVEASAQVLQAALVTAFEGALALSPNVLFRPQLPGRPPVRYIARDDDSGDIASNYGFLSGTWPEVFTPDLSDCPPRFRWLENETALILVADRSGPHVLQLYGRTTQVGQRLTIGVNAGHPQLLDVPAGDFQRATELRAVVELERGFNRIEFSFDRWHQEAGSGRILAYLLEGIGTWPVINDLLPTTDGSFRLLTGFDQAEGPSPELSLAYPFYWANDRRSTLEVGTTVTGRRELVLTVRSLCPGQSLSLSQGVRSLGTFPLTAIDLTQRLTIIVEIDFDRKWTPLTIQSSETFLADEGRRNLAFILEGVALGPSDGDTIAL